MAALVDGIELRDGPFALGCARCLRTLGDRPRARRPGRLHGRRRDAFRALAPEALPEPGVQVHADGTAGYREPRLVEPPPAAALPGASVGAWWALFWLGGSASNLLGATLSAAFDTPAAWGVISFLVDVAQVILAVLVVRALTARLAERLRRVRYNPPEVLRSLGMDVA